MRPLPCPPVPTPAPRPRPQVPDLYDPREQWASYLINAIKAKELVVRDVGYIVRGGEVIIVDEFTGGRFLLYFLQNEKGK